MKDDLEKQKPDLEKILSELPELSDKPGDSTRKPIEEKCTELKAQVDECGVNLDELCKQLDDQIDHAQQFNDTCDALQKWLPEAQASPVIVNPIKSDPEGILKQIEDVKPLEEEIVAHRPTLEDAQKSAAWLLDANKDDPEKCAAIEEKLKSVALPFHELVNNLDDKQKKLNAINKALDSYMKEKDPLEEVIKAAEQKVDNLEPVGSDLDKNEADLKDLENLLGELEKRKPDLRAVNRAGQALIRQFDDSPDNMIEKDLDKLSDRYYEVVDKAKDKEAKQKDALGKVKYFIEIVEVLEVWIEEVYVIIGKVDTSKTEPEAVKKQLEVVQDTRMDLRKHMPQLKEAEEVGQWCVENCPAFKPVVEERLPKVQVPMEETIPEKLNDLENKLSSNLASSKEFLDDANELQKFLNKMNKTLADQKPVSADKNIAQRQLNEENYNIDELKTKEPQFEELLNKGDELLKDTEPSDEKKALEDKLKDIKDKWDQLKKETKERKKVLDEVTDLINKLDEKKNNELPCLDDIDKKADTLDCIAVDPEKLTEQEKLLDDLLENFNTRKPAWEDVAKVGDTLVDKADVDTEPVQKVSDDLRKQVNDVEEKLKRAKDKIAKMKDSLNNFDTKRKPIEELCKQSEVLLDESFPLGDNVDKADEDIAALQKLLNEMTNTKPTVEEAKKAGDDVIAVDNNPDNVTVVNQRNDQLAKTYDDRLEKLHEKIDKLNKDKNSANNFKQKVKAVGEKIQPVKAKTEELQPIAATPEKVKEQLLEVEELQNQLQEARNLFNEANTFGNEMIEASNNDPKVKKDVKDKLAALEEPLKECIDKLNEREQKLKDQLQQCGAFQDQIDDFLRRVDNLGKKVDQQVDKPLSMKEGPMANTLSETKDIKKDIDQEKPVFNKVLEDGKKLLDTIDSPTEKEELKEKLDNAEKTWNDLQKRVDDEIAKESDVAKDTKDLDDKMAALEKLLDDHEKKLRSLIPVACSPEQLNQQQKEINVSY